MPRQTDFYPYWLNEKDANDICYSKYMVKIYAEKESAPAVIRKSSFKYAQNGIKAFRSHSIAGGHKKAFKVYQGKENMRIQVLWVKHRCKMNLTYKLHVHNISFYAENGYLGPSVRSQTVVRNLANSGWINSTSLV